MYEYEYIFMYVCMNPGTSLVAQTEFSSDEAKGRAQTTIAIISQPRYYLSGQTQHCTTYHIHTYLTYCNRLNKYISKTNRFMAPYLHTYILYIHTCSTFIHACIHSVLKRIHTYIQIHIHTYLTCY